MLLKVSDGDGGWVLFDKVEQAHLVSKGYAVKSIDELKALGDENVLNLISKECFLKGEKVVVGVIEFVRNGNSRKALFTNIVYVCNDNGDTLDRHNASYRSDKGGTKK